MLVQSHYLWLHHAWPSVSRLVLRLWSHSLACCTPVTWILYRLHPSIFEAKRDHSADEHFGQLFFHTALELIQGKEF
jgi:hypothetical protein